MPLRLTRIALSLVAAAVVLPFFFRAEIEGLLLTVSEAPPRQVSQAELTQAALSAQIVRALLVRDAVLGYTVTLTRTDGQSLSGNVPAAAPILDILSQRGVPVDQKDPSQTLFYALNAVLLILCLALLFRPFDRRLAATAMAPGPVSGSASPFGQSKARRFSPESTGPVTFEDVAGIDEIKSELEDLVDSLKNPDRYKKLGAKPPKGVLLSGPPGVGKTLLARAIASEAGVPFFTVSGSDFVEMFAGVGASRVRDLFLTLRENAPCICFIDEIDAIGGNRSGSGDGAAEEREHALNQMLVEFDGFEGISQPIVLLAATNRPEILDPALLRPGRFDREISVPVPDILGRERILKVHLRTVPVAPDVNLQSIAKGIPGFTGADIANLVNQAANVAAQAGHSRVHPADFEEAKDRILLGSKRALVMDEMERRLTAWHEAGHAVAALAQSECDPIHKVTIIPRGRSLGLVVRLPDRDRVSISKAKLLAELRVALAGREAERLLVGDDGVTTGSQSDIRQATAIARRMIEEWGFSSELGPQYLGSEPLDGTGSPISSLLSSKTAAVIDLCVTSLLQTAQADAAKILVQNRVALEAIAAALLERETLQGDDIARLFSSI